MLPNLVLIRQRFRHSSVPDVGAAVREALSALNLVGRIHPGSKVGIPVGSRGIRHIPVIIREVVRHVKALGAVPVVMAAMGSHGGGTPEGQLDVLHSLGITEDAIEAPVLGGVEADEVGRTADGTPVYFDRVLLGCDSLLVLNRVKPHTTFRAPIESGLLKMLVVGCGKPAGAELFHGLGPLELGPRLREFGELLLQRLPLAGGIAILENQMEETAAVVPVPSGDLIAVEELLLEQAKELLPRLPVDRADLLVVDQMGKNFSGTGIDTNVTGRFGVPGMPETGPWIKRIAVLDLSEASHGNANGVGMADVVTRRLVNKIDLRATYLNTLTTTLLERAKIPMTLESDREAVQTALRTLGSPAEPRIIRIKNTLELEQVLVSPAVLKDLRDPAAVEVVSASVPWPFDEKGDLF